MRAVRKLDDDQGIPEVDQRSLLRQAQAAKQVYHEQAGEKIEENDGNLKGQGAVGGEPVDYGEQGLSSGQVW